MNFNPRIEPKSNRIISLHLDKCQCKHKCLDSSSCYLLKRESPKSDKNKREIFKWALHSPHTVYDSICEPNGILSNEDRLIEAIKISNTFTNYNYTFRFEYIDMFSKERYKGSYLKEKTYKELVQIFSKKRAQISINFLVNIDKYDDIQLVHLINSDRLIPIIASEIMNRETKSKVHLAIDQGSVSKEAILQLIKAFNDRKAINYSLDSCLTSWVVNGCCPYEENYIDIDTEGKVRKCPFAKFGVEVDNFENAFDMDIATPNCLYKKIFSGETDGRKQNPDSKDYCPSIWD